MGSYTAIPIQCTVFITQDVMFGASVPVAAARRRLPVSDDEDDEDEQETKPVHHRPVRVQRNQNRPVRQRISSEESDNSGSDAKSDSDSDYKVRTRKAATSSKSSKRLPPKKSHHSGKPCYAYI